MTIVPTSETSHGGTDPIRCSIEALFEALETPLLGYAFRLVQSGDLAQDLVQEAASETAERLRASFPEIGHTYTFEQSLQFEDWSSLELSVEARLSHLTVGWGMRMGFVFLSLGALWVGLLMTSALTRYGR